MRPARAKAPHLRAAPGRLTRQPSSRLHESSRTVESTARADSPDTFERLQQMMGNRSLMRALATRSASANPRPTKSVIRRFGAGDPGHGGIESEAAWDRSMNSTDPTRMRGIGEMYSGNFMRDMNQLNVPLVLNALSAIPRDPVGNARGPAIGLRGAHDITTAVIQALAILEFGPEVADALVTGGGPLGADAATPDRIGAYRPEEHIDNPMGTAASDTVVNNTDPTAVDSHGTRVEIAAPRPAAELGTSDADRSAQLQGAAIPGLQVENQDLYRVSPGGLQNHIYNSVESVKGRWGRAAELGPTPVGRSEFGAGLHAVEDYFSHSNFIEVGLNRYIGDALASGVAGERADFAHAVIDGNIAESGRSTTAQGFYVDTLFDETTGGTGPDSSRRQAVTTGTFGGLDTKVSIAHILVPQLPRLQSALFTSIDRLFGLPVEGGGWERLRAALSTEPVLAAGGRVLEGFANAGVTIPVPDLTLTWGSVDVSPGIFGEPWSVDVPTGIDHLVSSVPITDGVAEYHRIHEKAEGFLDTARKVRDTLLFLPRTILAPINAVIAAVQGFMQTIENAVRRAMKEQVVSGLVRIVDAVSGRSEDEAARAREARGARGGNDAELNRDLGDALHFLHEGLEEAESRTSIESRLYDGDLSTMSRERVESMVGPVREVSSEETDLLGRPVVRRYYVPVNPLPPSHSELAKDHESHEEHHGGLERHGDGDPDLEEGSPFFGLARALAVEADRHCFAAMQSVWQESGSADTSPFGDGRRYEFRNDDADGGAGRHNRVLTEARGRAADEHATARSERRAHLTDVGARGDLLALVDLFISHPDDSTWWQSIFDAYVRDHREDVMRSILRRNRTRANRHVPPRRP